MPTTRGNAKTLTVYSLITIAIVSLFSSCASVTQLKYFKDLPDTSYVFLDKMPQEPRIIQQGDRLQITIGAVSDEAAAKFNTYGDMPTSGGTNSSAGGGNTSNSDIVGYWVDHNGQIEFPVIGKVTAEGLTALELKDKLTLLVTPYLKEPLVNVKFISFKFTVLGEVRSPGTFVLPQQRTTLLDALGAAGDLPRSAKRYDIQLYRDYNGQRFIAKIDLRKKELLSDQTLFQVRNNDIFIIQPRASRLASEETRTYVSLITLLVGAGTLLIGIFYK